MGVDQILQIDLSKLTAEGLAMIDEQMGNVEDQLKKAGKKPKQKQKSLLSKFDKQDEKTEKKFAKLQKQLEFDLISKKGKKGKLSKLFGDQASFKNIAQMGLNPRGFIGGLLKKGIPGFGAAVAATAIIVAILKKFDDLEKKFTDKINTKRNADRDNREVARIQAGLAQDVFSAGPGVYDPRDTYNSLNDENSGAQTREINYVIRNTGGVE